MLRHLKMQFEKVIIASMIITLMFVSAISWGKILTSNNHGPKAPQIVEKPTTSEATSHIRNGIVLFAGLAVIASEYLQLSDEE